MATAKKESVSRGGVHLEKLPVFSKLASDELENLRNTAEFESYKKGRKIVSQGHAGDQLIFLLEGEANVVNISTGGKEVILARLKPGDYFGEISLLTGTPRTADVIAETPCKTLELTKKKFFAHSERFAGLPLLMLEVMATRLQSTSSRVVDSTFLDVPTRLLKYLYGISSIVELNGKEHRLVRECPSHQELAACVGSSREVITRTLKQLEKDGCISRKDKQVLLRDLVLRM